MMSKMYGGQPPSFVGLGSGWWVVPDGARFNPTVYDLSGAGTGADFNYYAGLNYDNGIHWTGLGYIKTSGTWINQSYCMIRSRYPYNNSWERSQFISNSMTRVCTAKDGTMLGVAPGGYGVGGVFSPVQAWIWYPGATTAVQVNLGTELASDISSSNKTYWNGQQFVIILTDGSWISVALDGTVAAPSYNVIPGSLPYRLTLPSNLGTAAILHNQEHPTVKTLFYSTYQTWNGNFNEFYPQFAVQYHDGTTTAIRRQATYWGLGAVSNVFYFQGYWYARGITDTSAYSMMRTSKNIWLEDVSRTDWITVANWPSANIIQPFI